MSLQTITLILAFVTGFLSLSLEIIWFRIVDFTREGLPETFGYVLGAFLIGIAFGALIAGRLSLQKNLNVFKLTACLLISATFLSCFSIPLVAQVITVSYPVGLALCLLFIALVACAFGVIFPLLCHVTIGSNESIGRKVSYIYLANILGATISPLVTGFYLLDHFDLSTIVAAIATISALASVVLYAGSSSSVKQKLVFAVGTLALSAVLLLANTSLYENIFAKLQYKTNWSKTGPFTFPGGGPFKYVVENRSGLITVKPSTYGGDVIYGGGFYDGRFNIEPNFDANGIRRAFLVAALHKNPSEVLQIGLSSASWALVLDAYEPIKSFDIVEINHGYAEVIRHYPQHSRVLESDKAKVHFDDGRRWLNRNPDRKFDLIVMNVTFHGRNNATNQLSVEYLEIVKSHLKPGGVAYYNATSSEDVFFTAAQVFKHIMKIDTFVAASDLPFGLNQQTVFDNLQKFTREPIKAMYQTRIHPPLFRKLSKTQLVDIGDRYRNRTDLVKITDDNMATEFRRVSPMGGVSWISFLGKL